MGELRGDTGPGGVYPITALLLDGIWNASNRRGCIVAEEAKDAVENMLVEPAVPAEKPVVRLEPAKPKPQPENPEVDPEVVRQVRIQFEKELDLLKKTGGLAIKVLAAAAALFFAVFTLFGISTWADIKSEATEYVKKEVSTLIDSEDASTGVKQTVSDLVNQAIVDAALIQMSKGDSEIALPDYQWRRIRNWVQSESLDSPVFTDAISVLNRQSPTRKERDTLELLAEMLDPPDGSKFAWMRKQPNKRLALLSNFRYGQMGSAAVRISLSNSETEAMRLEALGYIQLVNYTEGFANLIKMANKLPAGKMLAATLVTCGSLSPADDRLKREAEKLLQDNESSFAETTALLLAKTVDTPPGGLRYLMRRDGRLVAKSADLAQRLWGLGLENGSIEYANSQSLKLYSPFEPIASATTQSHEDWTGYWGLIHKVANQGDVQKLKRYLPRSSAACHRGFRLKFSGGSQVTVRKTEVSVELTKEDCTTCILLTEASDRVLVSWQSSEGDEWVAGELETLSGGGFLISTVAELPWPQPHSVLPQVRKQQ